MRILTIWAAIAVGVCSMAIRNANFYHLADQATAFGAASVTPTGGVARVADNPRAWGGALTGMPYHQVLEALVLDPKIPPLYTQDCSLEKVAVNAGAWRNALPAEESKSYLQNTDCTPDQGTVGVTETPGSLTANPCISARFYRAARPAGSTEVSLAEVMVSDGAGVTLTAYWTDTYIGAAYDSPTGHGEKYYAMTPEEAGKMAGPGLVQVDVWAAAGRLLVFFSPAGRLVILAPSDVDSGEDIACAAGAWAVETDDAGSYAVNVSQVTFATSGTFTTPPIEHLRAIGVGEAAPTLTVYPPLPAGCSAAITGKTAVGTTAYTYDIEVTGDGYSPCPIQAVSIEYAGTWGAAPRGAGWITTSTVQMLGIDGATETYPEDSLQRAGRVTQNLSIPATMAAFRAECAAHLSGATGYRDMNALVYEIGPAGAQAQRWVGVVRQVEEAAPLDGTHRVTYTVGGRGTAWADLSAVTVPALWGETLADAVGLILERAGVHPSDLDVTAAPATTVPDPGWGYGNDPAGAFTGASIQDALTRILSDGGAVLRDKGDGKFYLEPKPTDSADWATEPLVTTAVGATEAQKAESITRRFPYYSAWNSVLVLGESPEGAVIRSYKAGTGGVPYLAVKVENVGQRAPTQAAADSIATEMLADLTAGADELVCVNRGGGWWDWWAGDFAKVTDAGLDLTAAHYLITNLEINYEEELILMPVTMTLREVT